MDKLIEAAQGIIDYARIDRLSGCWIVPLMAVENLKAALVDRRTK
ncbi:MAG: hypothetical protein WBE72_18740 [Terracidiphilus sp.]